MRGFRSVRSTDSDEIKRIRRLRAMPSRARARALKRITGRAAGCFNNRSKFNIDERRINNSADNEWRSQRNEASRALALSSARKKLRA